MSEESIVINGVTKELKDISYEDISCQVSVGRSFIRRTEGRHKEYGYRFGVKTRLGEIALEEWQALAKKVIDFHGEHQIFEDLLEWERERGLHRRGEIVQHTLDLHIMRIFENELWVDFIPFNKKYAPERLEKVPVVMVTMECCKKPGIITRKRLQHDTAGIQDIKKTFCPICGAFQPILEITEIASMEAGEALINT